MYCRKCGKFIEYSGDFCKECLASADPYDDEEIVFTTDTQEVRVNVAKPTCNAEPVYEGNVGTNNARGNRNRKLGFGSALTSTILAVVAMVLSELANTILTWSVSYFDGTFTSADPVQDFWFDFTIVCVIVVAVIGLSIPAIILGAKSIRTFVNAKRSGGVAPVITLVFGIIGLAMAVSAISSLVLVYLNFGEILVKYPEII